MLIEGSTFKIITERVDKLCNSTLIFTILTKVNKPFQHF